MATAALAGLVYIRGAAATVRSTRVRAVGGRWREGAPRASRWSPPAPSGRLPPPVGLGPRRCWRHVTSGPSVDDGGSSEARPDPARPQ